MKLSTTRQRHPARLVFRARPHARLRLLAFPHAGGSASTFASWNRGLPDWIELVAVQYPGRGGRHLEYPERDLRALTERLGRELADDLVGDFAFFGHSLGALVAWELALHLERAGGRLPRSLHLSGHPAPGHGRTRRGTPLHEISDDELIDEIQSFGGMPRKILQEEELIRLALPCLRADLAVSACASTRPATPLRVPIAVYGGLDDPLTRPQAVLAWAQWTATEFRQNLFPGHHFFIQQNSSAFLSALVRDLDDLGAGSGYDSAAG